MQTLIVIPTYNERENIEPLVQEILGLGLECHILIIDDGSPDGTGLEADRLAKQNQRVCVIHRPRKLGLGTAYLAGFSYGLKNGYRYIITMDGDFSHAPRHIPDLLAEAKANDLVIGSRYVTGGGIKNWGICRRLLSWSANLFAKTLLRLPVNDCTAGFRCYRAESLQSMDLSKVFSDGYSFLVEMTYRCNKQGATIAEVPITFVNRCRGKSKISKAEIYKGILTLLRLRFKGANP